MTKKFLVTLAIVGILLTLIVSIAVPALASEYSDASVVTATQLYDSPKQILVDESNNGTSVTMYVNDELVVTLQSFGTAGFEWQLDQIGNASVLQKVSNQYIPPSSGIPGASGTEIWIFKAIGNGTSSIFMEESQPWSGGIKRASTFNLNVNVVPIGLPASSNLSFGFLIIGLAGFLVFMLVRKQRSL